MKIAYVTTYDASDVSQWSGTGYYIAQSLRDAGAELSLVGPLEEPRIEDLLSVRIRRRLYDRLFRNRFGMFDLMYEPAVLRYYAAQVAKKVRGMRPDIVFSPGTLPIAYLETDLPIVFWSDATFAAMIDFYPDFCGLSSRTVRVGHGYEGSALKKAALAIYSSAWAGHSATQDYGADPSKVVVIPFGANITSERTMDEVMGRAWDLEKRTSPTCELLFIGKEWERKGGPLAVQIAADVRARGIDARLTIVGCRPPDAEKLPEFVRVPGFISKTTDDGCRRLNQIWAESHFFVLPTTADCTPIVFAEANSFGLPVVTTNVGGIPTLVQNAVNGVMLPLHSPPEAFGSWVAEIFSDPKRYSSLVRSSFEEYKTRLNWQVAGETVMRHLEALLERRPTRR
jgi:glycosyltransferase involved in cell wall biosynthesis